MKVNFSGAEIPDFSPIPSGTYHMVVTGGEQKESGPNSKVPGTPMIGWELTVQDGPQQGRKVWNNTMLGGNGIGFLKGFLWACGQIEKDYDGELEFEIDDVIGSHVSCRVTVDTDRDSNNVKKIMPYAEAASDAMAPA